MKILVTGASGFVGSHLVPALLQAGHAVITTGRAGVADYLLDLTEPMAVDQLIAHVRPEAVLHLAGLGSVAASWAAPALTLQTNVLGTVNLLEALRRHTPRVRFLSVGSGEEYGMGAGTTPPWDEQTPCYPLSPYGISKLTQGHLTLQYCHRYQLDALHVRAFNHLGAGQSEGYVATDFASQIVRRELGESPPELRVGNLSARRDFLDVRDVVSAYVLLLDRGTAGLTYNVASGHAIPVEELLYNLLATSKAAVTVTVDPARMRPAEVPVAAGDPTRLMAETGWTPRYSLQDTVNWVMQDWRQRLESQPGY